MNNKLKILIRSFPISPGANNPWGDFNQMLEISTRVGIHPSEATVPTHHSLYFKVCKHTGQLAPMTEEQFKEVCVEEAFKVATALPIQEL